MIYIQYAKDLKPRKEKLFCKSNVFLSYREKLIMILNSLLLKIGRYKSLLKQFIVIFAP
jgi:hypothetical protein